MAGQQDEMSSILRQKLSAYDAFLFTTDLLQKALESEEMEKVDRFIEQREELIKRIAELDHRMLGNKKAAMSEQNRNDLSDKLKQLMAVDKDCLTIAVRRRDLARKDLMVVHRNKAGLKSYGPKNETLPKFIEIQT